MPGKVSTFPFNCPQDVSQTNCNYFDCVKTLISLSPLPYPPGSLPPSPADSGVSDVDSSSSGGQPTCSDELKTRLGLTGATANSNTTTSTASTNGQLPHQQSNAGAPGTFLSPNLYQNSPPPLRNLWNNRNLTRKYFCIVVIPVYKKSSAGQII